MMTRIPLWTTAVLALVMASAAAQEKPPLQTADLTARVVAMHYTFTSRPIDNVTFIARYAEMSCTPQPFTALRFGHTRENIGQTFRHASVRPFDISDRTYDRVSAIALITPTASLWFGGHVTVGDDDREPDACGVLEGRTRASSIGAPTRR